MTNKITVAAADVQREVAQYGHPARQLRGNVMVFSCQGRESKLHARLCRRYYGYLIMSPIPHTRSPRSSLIF